jgi:hypothetical protein
VLLSEFLPCKAEYDNIISRYKYATDFVRVGTELLNTKMVGTNYCCIGDPNEYIGLFFHKVACTSYYVPSKIK